MKWIALAVVGVALAGCPKKEPSKPEGTRVPHDSAVAAVDAVAAAPVDPSARAKMILDAQIAALKSPVTDDATLRATFDPAAVLLVPDPRAVKEPLSGFTDAILRRAPHQTVLDVRYDNLVASGNQNATWFTCTLFIQRDGERVEVRVTELATAESGWKVAVAAFTEPDEPNVGKNPPAEIPHATTRGALTELSLIPAKVPPLLEPATVVTGFMERYPSAQAATPFLEALPAMTTETKPREVHGNGWGFTLAQLSYGDGRKYPARVSVLVVAIPDGNNSWRIVALHYGKT